MLRTIPAVILALTPALALAEGGDPAKGEKIFRKCKACHAVGPGAKAKVGPELNGVVGRPIASTDFNYSKALQALAADGAVWTEDKLDAFLTNPRGYAKGTRMSFAGLRKAEDRADVIAYLSTLGKDGS